MKLWERIIEHRLQMHAKSMENQFDFIYERFIKAIHSYIKKNLLRGLKWQKRVYNTHKFYKFRESL